jgi:hypothetical protein
MAKTDSKRDRPVLDRGHWFDEGRGESCLGMDRLPSGLCTLAVVELRKHALGTIGIIQLIGCPRIGS